MSSKPSPSTSLPGWIVLVLGAVALLPYRLQFHAGLNDEAIVIQAGRRILAGQLPYRDFDHLYTPAAGYITGLWMGLGGQSMACARWLMVLVAAGIIAQVYQLARQLLPGRLALIPPALFAVSGCSEWPVLSYHWFAAFGLLVCLHRWLLWEKSQQTKELVLAGVGCGAAALCLQSEGVASFLAVTLALAVGRESVGSKAQHWLRFVAGVLAVWLPFLGFLALTGSLWAFVDNTILQVLSGLLHSHADPYNLDKNLLSRWRAVLSQWPSNIAWPQFVWLWQSLTTVLVWTLKYAFFFPVILLAAWQFRYHPQRRGMSIFLACWTFMMRERLDLLYSNYVMPLWYIALVCLLAELYQRRENLGKAALGSLLALYLSAAAVSLQHCSGFRYPVLTQAGVLWSVSPEEATYWSGLYRAAAQLTPAGSATFAWPYSPSFYVLSGTVNVSRSDFLVPGWQASDQVKKAAESLAKVDTIYHFPLSPTLLVDYPNIDPATFERQGQQDTEILTQGFTLAPPLGAAQVYQRSNPSPRP